MQGEASADGGAVVVHRTKDATRAVLSFFNRR
jgi:hypothetical protein